MQYTSARITINDQIVELFYPATPNMDQILREVIGGQNYPMLGFIANDVDVVMDIGANCGFAAVYFNFVYPNARVRCYEPSPTTFKALRQNVASFPRVSATQAGLSDQAGQAQIIFGGTGEASSLYANAMARGVVEKVDLLSAADEYDRHVAGAKCAVLKVDTEGSEIPILTSLGSRLAEVAAVYLEYHSEDDRIAIDRILSQAGHTLFASHATHPHRGELCFVKTSLLDARTDYSAQYIIRRGA